MKKIREKQLEKKLSLRRIQPDRKVKKTIDYYNDSKTNKKITESKKFDMIGDWTSNYGSTGANLARQIFSHLDFSSLQQGLLVSKCWYHYLTNDYVLWRQMSMKTKPYLENLLLRITNERCVKTYSASSMSFLKKYYECIENQNSIQYQAFIKNFRKVALIMVVLELKYICHFSTSGNLQFSNNMSFYLLGSKLSEEIMVKRISDPFCQKLNELFYEIRETKYDIENIKERAKLAEEKYQLIENPGDLIFSLREFQNRTKRIIQVCENKIQTLMELILNYLDKELISRTLEGLEWYWSEEDSMESI